MENLTIPARVCYSDKLILTTEQLAEFYETDPRRISENFNRNEQYFTEGKHYFKLEGGALREFKNRNFDLVGKKTPVLYLWTKQGAIHHCKMINSNRAWAVLSFLEKYYFDCDFFEKLRESLKNVTESDLRRVYAFELENGTVKIGYTKNIRRRMQTISSSSGLEITNSYATGFVDSEIAYQIEQACHDTFDEYRVKGEFFRISFADACAELDKYADRIAEENRRLVEEKLPTIRAEYEKYLASIS